MSNQTVAALDGAAKTHPFWRGPRIAGAGYRIDIEHREVLQVARVGGELTLELLLSTLHVLGIEGDGDADCAMLLDLRELRTVYAPGDLSRIGEEIALSFHAKRLALLTLPQRVTRISERAARRSGMDMRVFDAEEHALEWLAASE